MAAAAGNVRIGISGWTYAPWRGTFFPEELKQSEELDYASRQVRSIEINGTFYSLQRPSSYAAWHARTPGDFVFSVKAPRFVTHIKRLKDIAGPLANFFASGVLRLGAKLGPFLWQLPPSLPYDRDRLAAFFELLPRDTAGAARLARRHDEHITHTWLKTDATRPLRHALEVRHASFQTPEFIALLREHQVALVVADTAGKWPSLADVTADFVYARLESGVDENPVCYPDADIPKWAKVAHQWAAGGKPEGLPYASETAPPVMPRETFIFFIHGGKVRAPAGAQALIAAL